MIQYSGDKWSKRRFRSYTKSVEGKNCTKKRLNWQITKIKMESNWPCLVRFKIFNPQEWPARNFSSQQYCWIKYGRLWENQNWLLTKGALDCKTKSPCQYQRESVENCMENMHTDVRSKKKITFMFTVYINPPETSHWTTEIKQVGILKTLQNTNQIPLYTSPGK